MTIDQTTDSYPPFYFACNLLNPKLVVCFLPMETRTYKLIDLVGYQDGSVVSRTLVNRKGGTLTLFAFDVEQSLSEHTAPFDAVAQILDGEADITISGQPFHLRTGETIIMPANQPHAVHAPQKFKMLLTMIKE